MDHTWIGLGLASDLNQTCFSYLRHIFCQQPHIFDRSDLDQTLDAYFRHIWACFRHIFCQQTHIWTWNQILDIYLWDNKTFLAVFETYLDYYSIILDIFDYIGTSLRFIYIYLIEKSIKYEKEKLIQRD